MTVARKRKLVVEYSKWKRGPVVRKATADIDLGVLPNDYLDTTGIDPITTNSSGGELRANMSVRIKRRSIITEYFRASWM